MTLVLIFGFFGWFYPARIVRAQILSLREKEFIEAARMIGASDWRIIRSHLLPHLVAPIIVLSSITVAAVHPRRGRASRSSASASRRRPRAGGACCRSAPDYYLTQPWLMVWPGMPCCSRRSRSTCSATASATRSTRAAAALLAAVSRSPLAHGSGSRP